MEAFDSVTALDAEIFVPGHGPVQRSRALLRDGADLINTVVAHARAVGRAYDEAASRR